MNKTSAKGEKSKKKRKKSKGRKGVSKETDSSDSGEYDSDGAASKVSSNRISCRTNVRNSVLVKMSSIFADTPRFTAKGYVFKSGRKCKDIKLLPDSGATMTLIHTRIARRLGLHINVRGGEIYNLHDAQGKNMVVDGTCIIYVIPERGVPNPEL